MHHACDAQLDETDGPTTTTLIDGTEPSRPLGSSLAVALDEICREDWLAFDTGQGDNRLSKAGTLLEELNAE